jgi:hypothetical protein
VTASRFGSLHPSLLLWGALLVVVFGGRMYTTDVAAQYEVAESLTGARPLLSVSGEYGWTVDGVRQGVLFVPHGVGYSLLLVPAALSGRALGPEAGKVLTALSNLLFSLVLFGFWRAVAVRRYGGVSTPRMLVLAVGAMALVYGRMPYDVTAAAAAAMAGLWCMDTGRTFAAGACMGVAVLIRLDSLLLLPVFWRGHRELLRFAAGLLPFLLAAAWANWYRFGSPFDDGHGQDPAMAFSPLGAGIPGLLFSPGKGLLFYAPLCFLALFHQRDWRLWLPFALSLVFHGALLDWTGGTGWGPRFLFTSLPFLLLPMTAARCRLFMPAAVLTVLLSLAACWSDSNAVEQSLGPDLFGEPGRQAVIWTFSSSPLAASICRMPGHLPEVFGVDAAAAAGLPALAGIAVQTAGAGLLAWAGVHLLRRRHPSAGHLP